MILLDYSGFSIGAITSLETQEDVTEDLMRHVILNNIGIVFNKFKRKYGKELVIAGDSGNVWRKDHFPEYKANRLTMKRNDPERWEMIFKYMTMIFEELDENFPYKCLKVDRCEADDIIATLALRSTKPTMIVATDRDFMQLQRNPMVSQYSPLLKKMLVEEFPEDALFEKVCRGDNGDGVPSVLNPDDIFLQEGIRQKPLRKTKIAEWKESTNLEKDMGDEVFKNYLRNEKMIDLQMIPDDIKAEIINRYDEKEVASGKDILKYLSKKRCRKLISELEKFL